MKYHYRPLDSLNIPSKASNIKRPQSQNTETQPTESTV